MFEINLETIASIMNEWFADEKVREHAVSDNKNKTVNVYAQYGTDFPSLNAVIYPNEEKVVLFTDKISSDVAKIIFEVAAEAMEGIHNYDLWERKEQSQQPTGLKKAGN